MELPETRPVPDRVRDLFDPGVVLAHMSTVRADGRLSTNPVGVLLEDGYLKISTTKDRVKYRSLVADPRIALSIPYPDNPNRYLEVRGRAVLSDDTDRSFIDHIARTTMGMDRYPFDRPGTERVIVTVIAEQMSSPKIIMDDDPPLARKPAPAAAGPQPWLLVALGALLGIALGAAWQLVQVS